MRPLPYQSTGSTLRTGWVLLLLTVGMEVPPVISCMLRSESDSKFDKNWRGVQVQRLERGTVSFSSLFIEFLGSALPLLIRALERKKLKQGSVPIDVIEIA